MEWGRSAEGNDMPSGAPSGAPKGAPSDAPNGGMGRVLVCDDSEQIRRLIRLNLELDGYEVVEAVDGEAALAILRDITEPLPQVITVDVLMPRRDGWWVVAAIRADPRLAHISIVMVTASAQDSDRAHAERAAVDAFVAKPFDPDELLAKIGALVSGRRV